MGGRFACSRQNSPDNVGLGGRQVEVGWTGDQLSLKCTAAMRRRGCYLKFKVPLLKHKYRVLVLIGHVFA